jgi:hypothetical protein
MSERDGDTRRCEVGGQSANDEFSRLRTTALYRAFQRLSINRIASLEISVVDVYLLDCEHDAHRVRPAVE